MSISIVTWTLGLTAADAVTARAQALGLDGLQYAGDHRDIDPGALREHAAAAGLQIIAIDPFNAGPANPARASAQAAIAYYCQVVDFAAAVGQVPVTLQGLSQWTRNCANRDAAYQRLVDCCKAVDHYARERGVGTLYEVCNHYEVPLIHTAAQCQRLLEAIGGENTRMILDSFHMNIDEPAPLQTLREYASRTAIYHISDSGRGGIGTGHIDFAAQYRALQQGGFAGVIAIEPVLAHRTPSNPPANEADALELDEQIRHSAQVWRGYL